MYISLAHCDIGMWYHDVDYTGGFVTDLLILTKTLYDISSDYVILRKRTKIKFMLIEQAETNFPSAMYTRSPTIITIQYNTKICDAHNVCQLVESDMWEVSVRVRASQDYSATEK